MDTIKIECDACGELQRIDLADDEQYCAECGAPLDTSGVDRNLYLDD